MAVVILDNKESGDSGVVAMSGDGTNDVNIPSLLVNKVVLETMSTFPVF